MCTDVFRDPAKALMDAKKRQSMNRTWLALGEASVLLAIASALLAFRAANFSSFGMQLAAISALSIFIAVFIFSAILGYIVKIIVTILGGSGKYFEGLTAVSYAFLPMSASLLVAAIFALVPQGIMISVIATAIGFAYGISILFRGIKELFKTDLLTAFVAVFILIAVLLIAASVSFGLTALMRLSTVIPLG